MKVLIIGGTGVLSTAVTKEALKHGIDVTMINRGNRMSRIPTGVTLIKTDKNNRQAIKTALGTQTFDAVIDFLCYTRLELEYSFDLYSEYTGQYFFISSCAVYKTEQNAIADEDAPKIEPVWPYSIHKWECEQRLMNLADEKGINYTIIRPAVTYDDTRIPYGISPQYGYHWTLIARILAGKPIITWNKGMNYCCMMRVEDFAAGVIGLIGNPKAFNEAFNICGDEAPTFKDVLDAISDYLGHPVKTVDIPAEYYAKKLPERAGEILGGRAVSQICSNAKLKKVVQDFKQTIYLREGIRMTLDAYKALNYQHGIDWEFDGRTDRILHKYMRDNNLIAVEGGGKFVDYLGNASFSDRILYYTQYYSPKWAWRIWRYIAPIVRKLRKLKIMHKG